MLPVIPVYLYTAIAAAQQIAHRRAKSLDGDSSSDDLVETFNAVSASMSAQAGAAAREAGPRSKPFERRMDEQAIEDEEERLLALVAGKFGVEYKTGLSICEIARQLKQVLFGGTQTFDIIAIEKELGFNLIGVTLADFLDAIINPDSEAGTRVSLGFAHFMAEQNATHQRALLNYPDASDEELGLYSPFKRDDS